jgi:phosphatidylserine decarboxylase
VSVTTFAAAQLLRALPRVRLSRAVGRLCEAPLPPRVSQIVQGVYSRVYSVNLEEVQPRETPYASFDEFFTRPLREGARSISDDPVVSPADGMLASLGPVDDNARIFVKGQPYDVGELLEDRRETERYIGGSFAVVYLSPRDYHRVHCPVDGRVERVIGIPGDLYPVNSIGERHIPKLFVRNSRVIIPVETEELGRVAVVMVGAVIVGRITVKMLDEPRVPAGTTPIAPALQVRRGDEIGKFHLGSTVVLLLEPKARLHSAIGPILYGETLTKTA